MNMQAVYEYFTTFLPEERVKQNEPLKNYTFTKVGGNADIFVIPSTVSEAQQVVKYAHEQQVPITFLGNGSNVIIKDGGIRGITLTLIGMKDITVNEKQIVAQSGAAIIDVSKTALTHSFTGLEFACGIPGTVGGALYMNAGAYGGEVSEILTKAVVLTKEGELKTLTAEEFGFGYRKSAFEKKEYIILEATFSLEKGIYEDIKGKMDDLTHQRESKQPLEFPSCGSVFKRPPNHFAGKLIQDAGLQGKKIGGVQVSTKHAGFMVNVENGTANDYVKLIRFVQDTVQEKFGVTLEREVKFIGED